MGKNKKFVKSFLGKRKSYNDNNRFKKKRVDNEHFNGHKIIKNQVHENITVQSESEDETPYMQLVKSFKDNDVSKYLSSSDSENDEEIIKNNETNILEDSVVNEEEETDDESEINEKDSSTDPFEVHFQRDLNDTLYEMISSGSTKFAEKRNSFPILGKLVFKYPNYDQEEINKNKINRVVDLSGENEKIFAVPGPSPDLMEDVNWNNLSVKTQIQDNIYRANLEHVDNTIDKDKLLTPLQKEIFSIVNNYQDLYYPNRTLDNGDEEIRFIYSLHAVNHALKTRLKVIHHNARLTDKNDIPDSFRDQGLVRPKVLIVVPFRDSAFRIIKMIISILLPDEKSNVVNKKRFYDEFTGGEIAMPYKNPKPLDYEKTFKGNVDDNFKIGLSVTKKSLKLYADFYSSDIIIASPLGLRIIVGAEGESERDFDFLASIEVLILDQTEVILMQNWDHLVHILDHLHMQPQKSHGTDFSRVRNWALNGWTQYYRQTLLFSSQPLPLITALFMKKCKNYAGKVIVSNPVLYGSICQVAVKIPQVFCRIDCNSSLESIDKRFNYFIKEILPQMKDPFMKHTLVYVPSYFDFITIRNYFNKEMISFVQICEYFKDGKIASARDKFFHGESHFLLYSERFHFFRRIRVKGIRHIVFYQPCTLPNFYSELCNLILDDDKSVGSVTTLYTKYDIPQMAAIVGTERANRFLKTSNNVHRIVAK